MDTQNLQAFLSVAEKRSFSLAAEQLHLTQPAVSKRVAALEGRLGNKLFDRIGRRVGLTEAGTALLPHARSIIQHLQQAEQVVRDLSGDVGGRLLLGTSHHIGLHRLAPVLRRFNQSCPEVKLDLAFMDSEQAHEQVMQGRIELAVVTLALQQVPGLVAECIWPDPLDFVVARDHPLAGEQGVGLEQLSRLPVILPGMNTYTGQIVKSIFDRRQLSLNVAMSTNYLETIRVMASAGLGWTVLPRSMVDDSLLTLSVPVPTPQRELGYIYHRRRSLSNAARAFIEQLH